MFGVMSTEVPEPCCGTMRALTRTRDDLQRDPELAAEMDLTSWRPQVNWSAELGMFCVGHIAIRYCPWCGADLPDPHAIASKPSTEGLHITVSPDGDVFATLDGERVVPASITRLVGANEDDRPPG